MLVTVTVKRYSSSKSCILHILSLSSISILYIIILIYLHFTIDKFFNLFYVFKNVL